MIGFIIALEKAFELNWKNIWIETDSMYAFHLFNRDIGKIPWRLFCRWTRAKSYTKKINPMVTHIHRKGNNVADKMASQASSSQISNWWMGMPDHIAPTTFRDLSGLLFYRFTL